MKQQKHRSRTCHCFNRLWLVILATNIACSWAIEAQTNVTTLAQQSITRNSLYVRTRPGFGIPINPRKLLGPRKGILECDRPGTTCNVANMPLLSQSDPRIDNDVKDMEDYGCYDTSIVTVVLTALADREPSLNFSGRTRDFSQITARDLKPKEIEQLSQQYRWAKEHQANVLVGRKIIQPLYFDEVLADFGKINEPCDPYTYGKCAAASNQAGDTFRTFVTNQNVTNEYIIDLMRQGYVTMIAYARYNPVIEQGKLTFQLDSRHKVVFSGFQPGEYPLLINDVSNGKQFRVRLTTDLSERLVGPLSLTRKPIVAPLAIRYPSQTRIFLEYEAVAQKITDQVFFIEHVDGLRIKTK